MHGVRGNCHSCVLLLRRVGSKLQGGRIHCGAEIRRTRGAGEGSRSGYTVLVDSIVLQVPCTLNSSGYDRRWPSETSYHVPLHRQNDFPNKAPTPTRSDINHCNVSKVAKITIRGSTFNPHRYSGRPDSRRHGDTPKSRVPALYSFKAGGRLECGALARRIPALSPARFKANLRAGGKIRRVLASRLNKWDARLESGNIRLIITVGARGASGSASLDGWAAAVV